MKISVESLIEKIIWVLMVFMMSSFLIFDTTQGGRYAFFVASVLVALLSAVKHKGILRFRLDAYHVFGVLFAAFAAISSFWAIKASDALYKASTLLQILGCASLMFMHYDRENSMRRLYLAVMWSGYFVTMYSIAFYGMDTMLASAQDIRLENEFTNINSIAMAAALSCMFQLHELMQKKSIWSSVFMIPAVILITATQSRKALILLLTGVVGVYILNSAKEKGTAKKILKLVFYGIILLLGLRLLFQLPIFSGSLERMTQLLNFWTDSGKADHSTIMRNNMVEMGIEWFKKYPIAGIGIGNPHILARNYLDFDAYLHNNFVELLCGGGIIGFALYYAMYVYLGVMLYKHRAADPVAAYLSLIWLALMLIMNYGMVTYYSKLQWYYLAIHFINVNYLKRKHREMTENAEKSAPEGDPVPDKQ